MLRSCFARLGDNRLFCFYYQTGKGISYRIYENNKWGRENSLIDKGRENFSVNIDNNGVVYVFCQDDIGDIVLCRNKSEEWTRKVVLRNQSSRIRMVQLNTIFTKTGLCLVYNIPGEDKSSYIVSQMLDDDGSWTPASRIDKFISLPDSLFQMQQVSNQHYILYYMTWAKENNIGYREITPEKFGRFVSLHSTGNIISDSSFLTTGDNIHALYVVKNMFSAQLFYCNIEAYPMNNSLVLAEAQKIENCLLFIARGILYATYIVNSQLFYCISDNMGNSFSRPARYKDKFCIEPIKANYLFQPELSESDFFCRQIYVDSAYPWDAQLIPDLCDYFYPIPEIKKAEPPAPSRINAKQESKPVHRSQISEEDSYFLPPDDDSDDLNANLAILQNKLAMSQEIIADKDRQIFELTVLMKNRADEMSTIEFDKQNQYRALRREHDKTLDRLTEVEASYNSLKREYEKLAAKAASIENPSSASIEDIKPAQGNIPENENNTQA